MELIIRRQKIHSQWTQTNCKKTWGKHQYKCHVGMKVWKGLEILTEFQQVECCCSVAFDSETPWAAAHQAFLSSTVSWNLLKLTFTESVMPSNHLILCGPFSCCPQSFPASGSFPMNQLFESDGPSISRMLGGGVHSQWRDQPVQRPRGMNQDGRFRNKKMCHSAGMQVQDTGKKVYLKLCLSVFFLCYFR